jgi:hypothetical protein
LTIKPPTDEGQLAKGKAWGQENLGRPDIYDWRVERNRKGVNLTVKAIGEKTTYTVDKIITDNKGTRLTPTESDKKFFNKSTVE